MSELRTKIRQLTRAERQPLFDSFKLNQYPSKKDRIKLAKQLHIQLAAVTKWFTDRRQVIKRGDIKRGAKSRGLEGDEEEMPTGETNDVDELNLEGICVISSDDEDDFGGLDQDSCAQSREVFGKWAGVEDGGDWNIVWPPMVIVRNTQFQQDENGKWIGMGTKELVENHKPFGAVEARNAFGAEGHEGVSVLIFDGSVEGYEKAELLSKKFERQGVGRDSWFNNPSLFHHSGSRQLFGYMATVQDCLDLQETLNGKWKLNFELASYEEKVVRQCEKWNQDSQQRKERELNDRDRFMNLGEEEMRG